jgi:murein DD-endopeptidase MepM/ murein hydrolase activator NlpD
VPTPSLPGTGDLPGGGDLPGSGGGTPGSGDAPGGGSGSPAATSGTGPATTAPATPSSRADRRKAAAQAEKRRKKRAEQATPMVAGTPAARDLLDDEHSPQLLAASRDFLTADQGIAEIARRKRELARLKQTAAEQAATYRALDMDLLTARVASDTMHERHDAARRELVSSARTTYASGQPTTDDGTVQGLAAAVARLQDGSTRADMRVGTLTVLRDSVRTDFERTAARYKQAKRQLADVNAQLAALAQQRSTALAAVQAARGSDVALNQARVAESGTLGAQIQAASAVLERSGRTVQGSGRFASPAAGHVTSPFGMRHHPILQYTKLHTGLDLAGGDPVIRAADSGRVILTVVSEAYGNFTVIDHGVIDGRRVTTAYAHQAQFLVREGQAVAKGDRIGVIGSTGYSTGPHLHFEVREDGTVVDPLAWLAGR